MMQDRPPPTRGTSNFTLSLSPPVGLCNRIRCCLPPPERSTAYLTDRWCSFTSATPGIPCPSPRSTTLSCQPATLPNAPSPLRNRSHRSLPQTLPPLRPSCRDEHCGSSKIPSSPETTFGWSPENRHR